MMKENGVQMITLEGKRFAILPEAEYKRLTDSQPPPLLPPDKQGNYPAIEAARVVLARKILRRRRAAGLSQAELAERAGVRIATLARLEKAKSSSSIVTVDKIERALAAVEAG